MRKLLSSVLALAAVAGVTAPAAAQRYGYDGGYRNGGMERQLDQIVERIRRAEDRGAISRREEARLLAEARQIRHLQNRYAYNGISRWEAQDVESRLQRLRANVRYERWDRDDRRF